VQPVFKDLHRNYYQDDGDMYSVDMPEEGLVIPVTRTREYENRILINQSLYHYEIVSDEEKDSLSCWEQRATKSCGAKHIRGKTSLRCALPSNSGLLPTTA
jgi:hypothetical protein